MNNPDQLQNYAPAYRRLMVAIKTYSSDTFDGSKITWQEAYEMSKALIRSVADQLGHSIDGVMLSQIHEGAKKFIKIKGEDHGIE